jgi:hypothetical protein
MLSLRFHQSFNHDQRRFQVQVKYYCKSEARLVHVHLWMPVGPRRGSVTPLREVCLLLTLSHPHSSQYCVKRQWQSRPYL